jgi:hypothetical protein
MPEVHRHIARTTPSHRACGPFRLRRGCDVQLSDHGQSTSARLEFAADLKWCGLDHLYTLISLSDTTLWLGIGLSRVYRMASVGISTSAQVRGS